MKLVINVCYGGFGLSDLAVSMLPYDPMYYHLEENRNNPVLVSVVEKLGKQASAQNALLKVVEVPDYIKPVIFDYDGLESVFADVTIGQRKCPACSTIALPNMIHCCACGYPLPI